MIRPDFGMYLVNQGTPRDRDLYYYDVRVNHVSVSGPRLYTFTTNIVVGGVEYCASFDFDESMLSRLMLRVPNEKRSELISSRSRVGTTVEFQIAVRADVKVRLGELQHAQREDFVPLVVTAFL